MSSKFNNYTRLAVTSTAETALKKLSGAKIGVYDCKKEGARFIFSIKSKDIKKAFAIFIKPCYNVSIIGQSNRKRVFISAVNRTGLVIGAFLFLAAAIISNRFIFKIEVEGSGKYLAPEVKSIIYSLGAREYAYYKGIDVPAATGSILALPNVTFCNLKKSGSVLTVNVEVSEAEPPAAVLTPLVSDVNGKILNVVAISGTAAFSAGDKVKKGDVIIHPYAVTDGKRVTCLAVGYAEIECSSSYEYPVPEQTEESLKAALSKTLLYGEVLSRRHEVIEKEGGAVYVIYFTYLHKIKINE